MMHMSLPVEGVITSALVPLNRHLHWYMWPAINLGAALLRDTMSASMILASARKVQRDALLLRGTRSAVEEADPAKPIDPTGSFVADLKNAEESLVELHDLSIKKRDDCRSDILRVVFREVAQIASSVHEEVADLRTAVTAHDAGVTMAQAAGQDARRLAANLERNDDVSPARRAALQSLVRSSVEATRLEDRSGDPAPL